MKIRAAIMVLSCLFMARCATYYHIMPRPTSDFFSTKERDILGKTTRAIEFDYGFDEDILLDYVFPLSPGFATFKGGERELSRAIEGMDGDTLVAYSEKIYRLKIQTALRMEKYRKDKNWSQYTYISTYPLPPLDHYAGLVEQQALKKVKGYRDEIEERKSEIERGIIMEMRRAEFEELWKYDYDS
ncbi:MAG: hypothetical protein E4G96_01170 [Chrysiogenales bacterium]|nr:MAG: hypothetical protein E4G96_01170 [Chrysiogenales bacterium]